MILLWLRKLWHSELQINDKSQKYRLEINITKTDVMVISRVERKPAISMKINGELLEQAKSFRYLGHMITEDGKMWNGN